MSRIGIAAAGNWIVDRVKTVDCLPGRGMLANIRAEEHSSGGAPANVLADLARMKAPFPLAGIGVVGEDGDSQFILEMFRTLGVDVSGIVTTRQASTSYTDVMTEERTGDRTFFHHRGANALFSPRHVPVRQLSCRIFHLGYLLLLDAMDRPDRKHGTVAARLLHDVQAGGIKTSLDVVSEESDRFRTLVPPALKHVDYLILNEIEVGRSVSRRVRRADGKLDAGELVKAVDELYRFGNMELVAVHMPEGAYLRTRDGRRHSCGSLKLPQGFIAGTVGAGDAFCAGMLYGLHEGWDFAECARLGSCSAAACLSKANASDGLRPLREVLKLAKKFPERPAPVKVV